MSPNRKVKISELLTNTKNVVEKYPDLSPDVRDSISSLIDTVKVLANELGLNSRNSSKPPSSDRKLFPKKSTVPGRKKKPGGQRGHKGFRLEPMDNPTSVEFLEIDRRTLPDGNWQPGGVEKRQVIDVDVSITVTEYQSEVLVNQYGETFYAEFPPEVTEPVQYGAGVRATSVYLSQHQFIPQARVQDVFESQFGLKITKGSVNNFNHYAAEILRTWSFQDWLKRTALSSELLFADETGTNIDRKNFWIHCLCNEKLSFFHVDPKRGSDAMDRMDVLPKYKGRLVHDHWKSYFKYFCLHVLCNAHHMRELERAYEQDGCDWAKKMAKLLLRIKRETENSGGKLTDRQVNYYEKKYRTILITGLQEYPVEDIQKSQSKSRNLLDRLLAYEDETLRFMTDKVVPFTNNNAERDLRMNKVQQKISGCFRTLRGAQDFCLIRSYLSTCRKNDIQPVEALRRLFKGDPPDFLKK